MSHSATSGDHQGAAPAGGQPWGSVPPGEPSYPEAFPAQNPAQNPTQNPAQHPAPGHAYHPGQGGYGGTGHQGSYPSPGPSDADATQFIPPVPGDWSAPPPPAGGQDADATQFIPPVTDGWPPPLAGPQDADATQFIPPVPDQGAGYRMQAPEAYEEGPRARHAVDHFDALYRDHRASAAAGDPNSTQQLPRVEAEGPPPYRGGGDGRGPGAYEEDDRPSVPRWALVALGTAACVVIGLTAGWLLSGGDGERDDPKAGASSTASADPSTGPTKAAKPADPAKAQAEKLSRLLATSNDSRTSVIRAVEDIKQCENLDGAAADLRAAARQRTALVTRLQALPIDKVPDSARLSESLTAAWRASAAADSHYANWADQMKRGKRGCGDDDEDDREARTTSEKRSGDRQSGIASQNKQQAAQLWNPTARRYGLPTRQSTQL
ncbi:hypothetical protein ACFQLX_13455 [Streptomyces polyrhachis]|uniref:Uncharacterized protein n=1 Tax=Streptomyces polyrhachis TaxID=1282885 RepID=A0ABW2GIC7_9ACTN